uniref:Uncharacterized protein n=1 Tax=viral metagenome TaxID=1070528 RepID=A0A6M3LPS4_9ZZZZ
MRKMIETVERLANDSSKPVWLIDWADKMYSLLTDKAMSIQVEDLQCIQGLIENEEHGIYLVGHSLGTRGRPIIKA